MFNKEKLYKYFSGLLLLIIIGGAVFSVQASPLQQEDEPVVISTESEQINPYFTVITETYSDGTTANQAIINGPPEPPEGFEYEVLKEEDLDAERAAKLSEFPSYNWVFGCSAVSGAMMAGYYDRHGFPNMYVGPKNGGVMPLSNVWGTWSDGYKTYPNNPLIASHKGVDGRTKKGSIDDYWVKYLSEAKDPYITGGWAQHTWGTAIGDYMKTSQSKYSNVDGSTSFWYTYSNGGKLTCADMVNKGYTRDGTLGIKQFYQKRGYTVTNCYSQVIDTYMASKGLSGGFTLADYKAQINAGNPVFINIMGHSMVGFGYGSGNTIYIRDTWDNNPSNIHTMQWGGSYGGMQHYQVVVVNLKKPVSLVPKPISPVGQISNSKPTYKWSKINNATAYQIALFKGTTRIFLITRYPASCGTTTCSTTPAYNLNPALYKWHVRAKVGGTWRAWSVWKQFTVVSTSGFNSQFTNNANGWDKIYGPWSIISGGYYRSLGEANLVSSIAHINSYPTFTYTVRMKRTGDEYSANRLYVRGAPYPRDSYYNWKNGYMFQYDNNKKFSVWIVVNGVSTMVKGWTYYDGIVANGWNTLKVVGNGTSMKYYINGNLVWQGNITGRATGRVGIGFYRSVTTSSPLLVDWAKLSTGTSSTADQDILAELGETNTEWDNPNMSPPIP